MDVRYSTAHWASLSALLNAIFGSPWTITENVFLDLNKSCLLCISEVFGCAWVAIKEHDGVVGDGEFVSMLVWMHQLATALRDTRYVFLGTRVR